MEEKQADYHASIGTLNKSHSPMISVIIPTRNEAKNLCHVLPYIPSYVAEVILVDGHSVDSTIGEAQRLLPSIKIIEQTGKGKGDALRAGFAASTGDIIIMLDADGSADPTEIPRFVEALLQGNDFAKGSRFLKGGGSTDITPLRHWGNAMLSIFVNLLFGTKFSDLCYGYNAFWKHCLDRFAVDCDGFEVETLINLRMHRAKLKIIEIPSFEHARIYGQSNLRTFRDGWRVLQTILHERIRHDDVNTSGKLYDSSNHQVEVLSTENKDFSHNLLVSLHKFDISIHISVKRKVAA
jgi:glycosyltransferase involved in cell wall biosynthesis